MSDYDHPFASREALEAMFASGLHRQLDDGGLGAFILVCANATFEPRLYATMADSLRRHFEEHAGRIRAALSAGRAVDAAEDDLNVFLRMHCVGFEGLKTTALRRTGPWELQFNQVRAFRPPRNASATVSEVFQPFDPRPFNFNRPFLRKEAIWAGSIDGVPMELLYNKFPFVDYHGLLVPEREAGIPQYLSERHHRQVWALSEEAGRELPGVGFGYNALGGYASINHLHFQMFVREEALPVCAPQWRHNGGTEDYPLVCRVFDDAAESWTFIDALQEGNTSFNLLYTPGRVYCLPRRKQGEYRHAAWTGGFAWYETAGGVITYSGEDYERLDNATIEAEYAKLRLTP